MAKPSWFFTSSPVHPFRLSVPAKSASGLHLVGWLHGDADEAALTRQATQHETTIYPLSAFRLRE